MDEENEPGPPDAEESVGPMSGQVRIFGADVAGERTGELPVVSGGDAPTASAAEPRAGEFTVHVTGEPAADHPPEGAVDPVAPGQTAVPGGGPTSPVLPHWTEPPTGEVPAVLVRDTGEAKSLVGPTWREEDADWVAHEEEFEPAMFGGEHADLGSLDESDRGAAERRPWEFDLADVRAGDPGPGEPEPAGGEGEAPLPATPITEEVPAIGHERQPTVAVSAAEPAQPVEVAKQAELGEPIEPDELTVASNRAFERHLDEPTAVAPVVATAAAVSAVSAVDRGDPDARTGEPALPIVDPPTPDAAASVPARARPTGTSRLGRARRNGLRPGRMRAKRPEDVAPEAPLAAEPPGAAVTEVPGAGRKRSLANLAAEDRTAERVGVTAEPAYELPPETHVGAAATTAAAAAVGTRGRRRLVRGNRPRSATDSPTSGGPPRRRRPTTNGSGPISASARSGSLGLRIGTGVAVAVIALVAFKLGTVPSLILTIVFVTFAAGESFGVLRRAGYQPATLLGLAGTVALMWGAYAKGISAIPAVLVCITVFTLIWYLIGIERSPVAGSAATLLTVGWVSLLGAYAALLLAPSIFPDRHGIAFLLGAVIAGVTNDVSGLAIGSWLGTRQLAPRISPNKTWEGLLGSAVVTVVVCTVAVGAIHPWDPATGALLGVVAAVVAPIGDLCESMFKRDLRLKDMGTLLPGHGGVLDRLDALIFIVPATYYLVRALHIG
jgi:CDP-diglyceride synthetase